MNSTQRNKTTGREAHEVDFYQACRVGTIERVRGRLPVTRAGMQARKRAFRSGRLVCAPDPKIEEAAEAATLARDEEVAEAEAERAERVEADEAAARDAAESEGEKSAEPPSEDPPPDELDIME